MLLLYLSWVFTESCKRESLQTYAEHELPGEFDYIVQSSDTAAKTGELAHLECVYHVGRGKREDLPARCVAQKSRLPRELKRAALAQRFQPGKILLADIEDVETYRQTVDGREECHRKVCATESQIAGGSIDSRLLWSAVAILEQDQSIGVYVGRIRARSPADCSDRYKQ